MTDSTYYRKDLNKSASERDKRNERDQRNEPDKRDQRNELDGRDQRDQRDQRDRRDVKTGDSRGIGLLAAVFFLVIVGLFSILALRILSTGSITSSEDFRNIQGGFSAVAARDLRALYLLSGNSTGWNGSGNVAVGPCTVREEDMSTGLDKDALGKNVTVFCFRLKAVCGGEGTGIGRTWEAVIKE